MTHSELVAMLERDADADGDCEISETFRWQIDLYGAKVRAGIISTQKLYGDTIDWETWVRSCNDRMSCSRVLS